MSCSLTLQDTPAIVCTLDILFDCLTFSDLIIKLFQFLEIFSLFML